MTSLFKVFNSIGIAFGSIIAFSSYNQFHGPILRNVLLLTFIDAAICIICGVAVFSTMGNLGWDKFCFSTMTLVYISTISMHLDVE